jgi:hypothetical protein
MSAREAIALAESRRIEELALNASAGPHSLIYGGWLLGYRRDPSKRHRWVNPFCEARLTLDAKIEHCVAFYAGIGLSATFRPLPFSQPPELDGFLDRGG